MSNIRRIKANTQRQQQRRKMAWYHQQRRKDTLTKTQ